jgi:hypothetical protein
MESDQCRIPEKVPLATSDDTVSISADKGRSSTTFVDAPRTAAIAFFANVPVCSGASRSIPCQAQSSSIANVRRKLPSMRSSRRAPLIPIDT